MKKIKDFKLWSQHQIKKQLAIQRVNMVIHFLVFLFIKVPLAFKKIILYQIIISTYFF